MKSHGMFSPKGNTKIDLKIKDLDRVSSAAALLSPKYTKKAIIPVPREKKPSISAKPQEPEPKPEPRLIDAHVPSNPTRVVDRPGQGSGLEHSCRLSAFQGAED